MQKVALAVDAVQVSVGAGSDVVSSKAGGGIRECRNRRRSAHIVVATHVAEVGVGFSAHIVEELIDRHVIQLQHAVVWSSWTNLLVVVAPKMPSQRASFAICAKP